MPPSLYLICSYFLSLSGLAALIGFDATGSELLGAPIGDDSLARVRPAYLRKGFHVAAECTGRYFLPELGPWEESKFAPIMIGGKAAVVEEDFNRSTSDSGLVKVRPSSYTHAYIHILYTIIVFLVTVITKIA